MTRAALLTAVLALTAGPAAGQQVRGTATSTGRFIQIRPIRQDSVPLSAVERRPDGDFYQGARVVCVAGFTTCVRYVATDVENAFVLTQDVSATAWGLGMQGLSATVLLRARADAGGAFDWPRSDDVFDAILAYAELDRGRWRVRLGRQRATTGLGFAGFDGVNVRFDPLPGAQFEAFAGRSLARGLNEPRNDALRGVEDFVLDRSAWLMGGTVWVEPWAGATLTGRYQREIWSDRSGLLSERASLDLRTPLPGPFSLSGAADYDFAFGRIGKANVTVRAPLGPGPDLWVEAVGRRYVPYFELWTIWGFFDPAAYHEAELRASWRATPSLLLSGYGGWRFYDDTDAPVILSELPDQARRAGLGAFFQPSERWTLTGDWALETGFGAFLHSLHLAARAQATERLSVGLDATALQQIEEFRVGDGRVLGAGIALGWAFNERSRIDVGWNVYRQTFRSRPGSPDWNQSRGWAGLQLGFGSDAAEAR